MKRMMLFSFVLGCSIDHKEFPPGGVAGECYPNGTCNSGLTCQEGYCFPPPDASTGGDGGGGSDSPSYACNDDSAYESNNDPSTAYGLPTSPTTVLTKLAICPANDLDYFKLVTTGLQTVEVQVDYDSGHPLKVTILNNQNTPLVEGTKVPNLDSVKAKAANLSAGTWLIRVRSDGTSVGNYNLSTWRQ